ncbi:DNA-directed RNA polymerase I subunit-like protein [Hapsidospora chrysogenum ATCC 11550]|uniref:DNA-directed RNA polymerase subunit n=1 Tax=Hapsidospora chrysogenum (strain ATCC 11550 / CBS 779.69 / DSM 880 / IAM 14645 / JCM 23072 / IMI 49137) TaxID=857340 RepID=A0A086TB97_HAPC1|nr:DNA-directed RNA polymerase I subunit-like protein [Hapsidospora chrysogenum ATCC 11550]
MAPIEAADTAKPKKSKSDKSAKKRAREEEAATDTERKHKKTKGVVEGEAAIGDSTAVKKEKKDKSDKKEKKDKKKKKNKEKQAEDEVPVKAEVKDENAEDVAPDTPKKKDKKKKSKKRDTVDDTPHVAADQTQQAEHSPALEAMDVDTTTAEASASKIHQPSDIPAKPQFPFFNQTVSLYLPLYPTDWARPITGCESQHLRHLKNRYVPSLRGVLLDYSNITLGEQPNRTGGAASTDDEPTVLTSRCEFGGGFGWVTASVRLFVPSRGAWMEGSVNLQTEGHIGVVCFGKWNASIEARRLPPSWRWVSNEEAEAGFEETASVITGVDEHGVVRQIHSTGYWVDASGEKISGRVRFRIRNFDVGVSGNATFLSLQGTMLDKKGEKELVKKEAAEAKDRKTRRGRGLRRVVPDFSMTRFAEEDEEEAAKGEQAQEARDMAGPVEG